LSTESRSQRAPSRAAASVDSIVLERTACFGRCPAYRLRLAADGRVSFASRNPDDSSRVASGRIAPAGIRWLAAEAARIGFYSLPPVIARDRTLCRDWATDNPTVTLTLFRSRSASRARGPARVEDYHGCFGANDHSLVAPVAALRKLEEQVDSVAGSRRWVWPALTPRRHADVDLSGAWANGSTAEPAAAQIVIHVECNYSPSLWVIQQRGDTVSSWTIPESRAQGIAAPHTPAPVAAVGRISGVNLTMSLGEARYVLRYDSTSGHLRGTLNGAPFWAIREDIVRPEHCIPVP
jgi:hypothetical protein